MVINMNIVKYFILIVQAVASELSLKIYAKTFRVAIYVTTYPNFFA